ncbi:hypothetical protein TgHK011_006380 [Trichoderma gracile]|nr:hypothetical protein TgHK011_006380 [Trichoderma gracile]
MQHANALAAPPQMRSAPLNAGLRLPLEFQPLHALFRPSAKADLARAALNSTEKFSKLLFFFFFTITTTRRSAIPELQVHALVRSLVVEGLFFKMSR